MKVFKVIILTIVVILLCSCANPALEKLKKNQAEFQKGIYESTHPSPIRGGIDLRMRDNASFSLPLVGRVGAWRRGGGYCEFKATAIAGYRAAALSIAAMIVAKRSFASARISGCVNT